VPLRKRNFREKLSTTHERWRLKRGGKTPGSKPSWKIGKWGSEWEKEPGKKDVKPKQKRKRKNSSPGIKKTGK